MTGSSTIVSVILSGGFSTGLCPEKRDIALLQGAE